MKYHEIVAASNCRRQRGFTHHTMVKQIAPRVIEEPIDRLCNDLIDALESRLMDIAPVYTWGKR